MYTTELLDEARKFMHHMLSVIRTPIMNCACKSNWKVIVLTQFCRRKVLKYLCLSSLDHAHFLPI